MNPCQFMVLYEDPVAHDRAMEVCSGVMTCFEGEPAFAFSFWKFEDLANSAAARLAVESATRADVLLLCTRGHDLPAGIVQWLDTCARARTKAEGAFALITTGWTGTELAAGALLSRMQYAAHQLRMDFLPPIPSPQGVSPGISALLSEIHEEPGTSHWGLNE